MSPKREIRVSLSPATATRYWTLVLLDPPSCPFRLHLLFAAALPCKP